MYKRFLQMLTVPVTVLASFPVFAQGVTAGPPGYWYSGWNWGWGHMLFGSVMMILFWGLLVFLIVLVVRRVSGGSSQGTTASSVDSAQEILQQRLARSNIDKKEFDERMRVLSN